MGINWDKIRILSSPLTNQIYIGKTDKTGKFSTDKSNNRTQEVLAATMSYMDAEAGKYVDKFIVDCPAGRLIWERKKEVTTNAETKTQTEAAEICHSSAE